MTDTPPSSNPAEPAPPPSAAGMERGLGLLQATALNISNMVGIGPFITIPLFIAAMGGPQAMIAWVVAAVLVLCDGLVWSELGAALPGSGGSYHFLREVYGRYRWGRLMPFLFIWQFLVSGTLELASGYVGVMPYVEYALPGLKPALDRWGVPGGTASLAALTCLAVGLLLSRGIRTVGWFAVVLMAGAVATVLTVIVAGLTHFDRELLAPPPGAFKLNLAWFVGLAASMRIAVYDYFGYYNVCHLGDEVRRPAQTIPRAVLLSVLVVAAMYLTMNAAILGVVPWQEAKESRVIASTFMERLFGRDAAVAFTAMIVWTAIASVFAGTLGASRIPYAAARAGDFFPVFGRLHPRARYPWTSLAAVTALTAAFCFVGLELLVEAAVTVRILVVFVGQILALHLLRTARPDRPLPFRMWLYPLPSLVALTGWLLLFATSEPAVLLSAGGVLVSGAVVFFVWRAVVRVKPAVGD